MGGLNDRFAQAPHLGSADLPLTNPRLWRDASWPYRHSLGFVRGKSALPNCCTGANHSSVRLGTQRSVEGFALRIARAVFVSRFFVQRPPHS